MSTVKKIIARPFLISAIFFLFSITIISLLYFVSFNSFNERRAQLAHRVALSQVHKIERELQTHLSTVQALASFVSHDPQITFSDFSLFTETLLQNNTGSVVSMAYSPGFKVQMIWPSNKVNDLAKNKVLTDRSGREHYLKMSADTKKTFIEGPTNFAHLDSALCLFAPVYVEEQTASSSAGKCLGVVDVILRWNNFAEITGLANLAQDMNIAIRGKDGAGKLGDVFFGDASTFATDDAIILPIKLPMGEWLLAVSNIAAPMATFTPNFFILSLIFTFLISLTIYVLLRHLMRYTNKLEGKYRYLIEMSSGVMWTVNYKTLYYTYISNNCKLHTGYSPAEYTKMTIHQICTPESVDKVMEKLKQSIFDIKIGKIKTIEAKFEIQHNTKWGTQIWTKTSMAVVMNRLGEPTEVIGISHMINDEKRLETAFEESQRQHQLIAKHMNEAVWLLDIKTLTCSFISESTVNVTGFTSENMLGHVLYDFMPPEEYEILLKHFEFNSSRLLFDISNAQPKTFEIQLYKKGAEPILAEMAISVSFDSKGMPQEFIVNVKNIEAQKKIETALYEAENKLLMLDSKLRDN